MSDVIKDGTGKAFTAKVDNTNSLKVRAVTLSEQEEALLGGRAFRIGSGIVTLTSASESYVLYLKNNDLRDIFIYEIVTVLGSSTGGTGRYESGFTLNPTGGTILSGSATAVINTNIGSSEVADVTATRGVEGTTASGGAEIETLYVGAGRVVISDVLILPKGSDIAFKVTPPTSNSSMDISITVKFYFLNEV